MTNKSVWENDKSFFLNLIKYTCNNLFCIYAVLMLVSYSFEN